MIRRRSAHGTYSLLGVLVLTALSPMPVRGQAPQKATATSQHHDHDEASAQTAEASGLVKVVRESTERFRDVAVAQAEGYSLLFGCVSGSDAGAMGLHYVKMPLVGD